MPGSNNRRLFFAFIAAAILLVGVNRANSQPSPAASSPTTLAPATTQSAVSATTGPAADARTAEAELAARAADERLEQVKSNLAAVKEILSIGLANDEAGQLLREARRRAPDADALNQQVATRERQVAEARLDRVRLLEQRRLATNPAEIARLSAELATQEAYLSAMDTALAAESRLAAETATLLTLLNAHLLWIGSAPAVGPAWIGDVWQGARWIFNPESWIGVGQTLLRRVGQTILFSPLLALFLAALIASRGGLKKRLGTLAGNVNAHSSDSFLLTIRATVVTMLLALSIPLALGGVGALLVSQKVDLFAYAIGNGLLSTAAVGLLLDFFREMCRDTGLADVHFGWNDAARKTLRNNLHWLMLIEAPAAFFVAVADTGGADVYRQGIGRLAFLVGSVALTIFIARVFRPGSGVFIGVLAPDGWAWRLRKLWYGLIVFLPALLTLAAAAGYYYTAIEVQSRFFNSGVVVLSGIVVYSLLTRWLLVTRRRLAIRQARQKLADQREARRKEAHEPAGSVPGEAKPEFDPRTVDIAAASKQTLALLRTMVTVAVLAILWGVWNRILPALSVLQSVALTRPTFDANGAMIVAPLTLWSLLKCGIAVVLTFVAARNLPSLLQLAVLQRFPFDAGIRYAAATLTRYIVIAIGILIASNLLGIDWSRAQWIIAALGVGLGFGLQEIVANFVSGLIILFERPVRVGDTVTVGDVTGVVSRLQIRATTITDWDNKEVIVPNKSFITDRVVNWTLSNSVTRLLIPIGIAYGSDIAKAHKAMTHAVKTVPTILDDPQPSVVFVGFGDSALNFEVRAFVGDLAHRFSAMHDLNCALDAALREAKIEVPFPQSDIHLRSSEIGELSGQP